MQMERKELLEIGDLKSFGVSLTHGFLVENPATKLPPYFRPWERIAGEMVKLVEGMRVRPEVNKMPLLDVKRLEEGMTEEEGYKNLRLAHLYLVTLMSGYVWSEGDKNLPRFLPKQIAIPLWKVCEKLGGVKAGISYMALVLANFTKIDENKPLQASNPDNNLKLISFKVIPSYGNDWFLLNTVQVELDFVKAIPLLIHGIQASRQQHGKTAQDLMESLDQLAEIIKQMEATVLRMVDFLEPDEYFNGFRPMLAGFTGGSFEEWGGIIFEGVSPTPQNYTGGSATQSSTLQCIDGFLGVKHTEEYLIEMRDYMPKEHKRFIETIEGLSKVREAVSQNPTLQPSFNLCVDAMSSFRASHMRMVKKFIQDPRRRAQTSRETTPTPTLSASQESLNADTDSTKLRPSASFESLDDIGTGGTGVFSFLVSCRNATKKTRV